MFDSVLALCKHRCYINVNVQMHVLKVHDNDISWFVNVLVCVRARG